MMLAVVIDEYGNEVVNPELGFTMDEAGNLIHPLDGGLGVDEADNEVPASLDVHERGGAAEESPPELESGWDQAPLKNMSLSKIGFLSMSILLHGVKFGKNLHDPAGEWPWGYKFADGKLYLDEKLCIPESLSLRVVMVHHAFCAHVAGQRLILEMSRRYEFSERIHVGALVDKVKRNCMVCQACERPNWAIQGEISMAPVPERFMASVCLDVFSMPATSWMQVEYDAFLLCVDRQSGWMIARPCSKLGLTGERAAHLLLDNCWGELGIPSLIMSDQGPQFLNQWWAVMCSRLGIRQAFSQSHRPQANGRAEVAGRVIQDLLRKMHVTQHVNWVEALPRVLRVHHDMVDPISGLSPYQVVFGRERNLCGLPFRQENVCMAASDFLITWNGWIRWWPKN